MDVVEILLLSDVILLSIAVANTLLLVLIAETNALLAAAMLVLIEPLIAVFNWFDRVEYGTLYIFVSA